MSGNQRYFQAQYHYRSISFRPVPSRPVPSRPVPFIFSRMAILLMPAVYGAHTQQKRISNFYCEIGRVMELIYFFNYASNETKEKEKRSSIYFDFRFSLTKRNVLIEIEWKSVYYISMFLIFRGTYVRLSLIVLGRKKYLYIFYWS